MTTREENLKKINAELEQLSDDELEQVAGGYYNTWKDYEAINKLEKNGYGTFYTDALGYCTRGVQDAFIKIGKKLGMNISAKLDLFYDQKPGQNLNRYFLDGKEIPRDELWNIINEGFAAKK